MHRHHQRRRIPQALRRYRAPVISDSVPGFAGPLIVILVGLGWLAAQRNGIECMVSVLDDCPFLPDDLVELLHRGGAR